MRQLFILFSLCFSLSLTAQEKITLLFVGDLMQHQAQIEAARVGTSYDYSSCFKHVKDEISAADLAIANLEVTLGGKGSVVILGGLTFVNFSLCIHLC